MIKLYTTEVCDTCRSIIDTVNELGLTCEIVNTSANLSDEELDEMLNYNINSYPSIVYINDNTSKSYVQSNNFTADTIKRNCKKYSLIK